MESNNNDKPKISLNRKMRMWNRYRTYIIGLAVVVVVIIVFAVVLKSCSTGKNNKKNDNTDAPTQQEQTTQPTTPEETKTAQEQTTQPTTTASVTGRSLSVAGPAKTEEFNSSSHYEKAMFIGDFVVSGISGFGFASDSQVIASNAMTSDKLSGYVDEIAAKSPESVYIMVGINDLNYGSRSVNDIYNYEKQFVDALKSKLPSANIYVLSVLPVSKRFESSSNVKQSNIDALNGMLSENAASLGITYVDVASAYKDSTGYFGSAYTDSGYNLKSGYYAFMLNGIAGAVK